MAIASSTGSRRANQNTHTLKRAHQDVPFCTVDGFDEISLTLLERMAGTTRLELATSAMTVSGL